MSRQDVKIPKLKFSPNNYYDWRKDLTNVIKVRNPTAGVALQEAKKPTFNPKSAATDPRYNKELEICIKREMDYDDSLPSVWAEIMLNLSTESEQRVSQHPEFNTALSAHDIIKLWKIIERTHISDPATRAAQISLEEDKLLRLCQGTTDLESYNAKYLYQIEKLQKLVDEEEAERFLQAQLKASKSTKPAVAATASTTTSTATPAATSSTAAAAPASTTSTIAQQTPTPSSVRRFVQHGEVVRRYLFSLNYGTFGMLIKDMYHGRNNEQVPTDLIAAMSKVLNWRNTEITTEHIMRSIGGDGKITENTSTPGPLANQASTTPNNKKKWNNNNKGNNNNNKNNDNKSGSKHCEICKALGRTQVMNTHNTEDCGTLKKGNNNNKQKGKDNYKKKKNNNNDSTVSANIVTSDDAAMSEEEEEEQPTSLSTSVLTEYNVVAFGVTHRCNNAMATKDLLVCDPGASHHIVNKLEYLTDVRELHNPIGITGVGGKAHATHIGNFRNFGPAYFCKQSPFNLLSFDAIRETFTRKFDDIQENFVISNDSDCYIFNRDPHLRLFVLDLSSYLNQETVLITYRNGDKVYTKDEIAKAHEARKLHNNLDHMSPENLCILLDHGKILNCTVTSKNVRLAENIFGPCQACLQGKMTDAPAKPSEKSIPDIGTTIHCDLFFLKNEQGKSSPYLIGVESATGYVVVLKLENKSTAKINVALHIFVNHFKTYGFHVNTIKTDNENNFTNCHTYLNSINVQLIPTGTNRHERKAERAIRTLKDRMRTTIMALKFRLPRLFYPKLVTHVVTSNNLTPNNKTTPAKPRELIQGQKLNAHKAFRAKFGDLVLAKTPNANNSIEEPKSDYGLVVGRDVINGTLHVYLFSTSKVVDRTNVVIIPPTSELLTFIDNINAKEPINLQQNDQQNDFDNPQQLEDINEMSIGEAIQAIKEVLLNTPPPSLPNPSTTEDTTIITPIIINDPPIVLPTPTTIHRGAVETTPTDTISTVPVINPTDDKQSNNTTNNKRLSWKDKPTIIETPPPSIEPTRQSQRQSSTNWKIKSEEKSTFGLVEQLNINSIIINDILEFLTALQISVRKGLKENPQASKIALLHELKQLIIDKEVLIPVDPKSLTDEERSNIIPAVTFLKEKYFPDGTFEKLKARMACSGDRINPDFITENTTSPTVSIEAVLAVLAIAAREGLFGSTEDITGAYLNCFMPGPRRIIMIIDKMIAQFILEIPGCEHFKPYFLPNGSILVVLNKALYGHPLAAKLWYDNLSQTFIEHGYTRLQSDECVFIKHKGSKDKSIITLHVDDILHVYSDPLYQTELEVMLRNKYKDITTHCGDELNYLGMTITFNRNDNTVKLTQQHYIEELLKQYNVQGTAVSPATQHLFEEDDNNDDDNNDTTTTIHSNNDNNKQIEKNHNNKQQKHGNHSDDSSTSNPKSPNWNPNTKAYASKVMSIMYLAKRTRPDLLLAISYLSTKIQSPTAADFTKLQRIFKYINGTKDMGLTLSTQSYRLYCSIDAAYNIYKSESKGHSGIILTLGEHGSPIFMKSSKQKVVARSSTDSELIALYDAMPTIIWIRQLLVELCKGNEEINLPAIVFQDNQSLIKILENPLSGKAGKSKHMLTRYNYVKERIYNKEIAIQYLPSDDMTADFFTKPKTGQMLIKHRSHILNIPRTYQDEVPVALAKSKAHQPRKLSLAPRM